MFETVWYGVGGRCAFDPNSLDHRISPQHALQLLKQSGCEHIPTDIVAEARTCIGTSDYMTGVSQNLAPKILNCTTFIAWAYGRIGVLISRRSMKSCTRSVDRSDMNVGDMVFISDSMSSSGGHVGMATGPDTVIHAQQNIGVVEVSMNEFVGMETLRSIERRIPNLRSVMTIACPDDSEIICSDDFRSFLSRTMRKMREISGGNGN